MPDSAKAARGRTSLVQKDSNITSKAKLRKGWHSLPRSTSSFQFTDKRQGSKFGQHLRGPSRESKSALFGRVSPSRQCLYDTPGGTIGLPATGFTSRPLIPRHLNLGVKLDAKGLVALHPPGSQVEESSDLASCHHAVQFGRTGCWAR